MDFDYDENKDKVKITAYKDMDICTKCASVIRNHCPLLTCIMGNYVYPAAQSLQMNTCSLYDFLNKEIAKEDTEQDASDCIWFNFDKEPLCGRFMPDSWGECKGRCEFYEERTDEPS